MNILVVTSCSKKKKIGKNIEKLKNILKKNNFPYPTSNLDKENIYQNKIFDFILKAKDMYLGSFKFTKNLVKNLEKNNNVDFKIISARYGLIDSEKFIIPYEFSLSNLSTKKIIEISKNLSIYKDFIDLIKNKNYDLTILVLGKKYLETIYLPEENIDFTDSLQGKLIIIGSKKILKKINYKNSEKIYIKAIGERNKKINELSKKLSE